MQFCIDLCLVFGHYALQNMFRLLIQLIWRDFRRHSSIDLEFQKLLRENNYLFTLRIERGAGSPAKPFFCVPRKSRAWIRKFSSNHGNVILLKKSVPLSFFFRHACICGTIVKFVKITTELALTARHWLKTKQCYKLR